jgi:hypothetical protein
MNWLSGILSLFSAGADITAGRYARKAGEAAAEEAEINADLAKKEAEADAAAYAAEARNFKAEQSVRYLKSGVMLEGTPLDVLDETARLASNRIAAIRAKGTAEARGYLSKASQYRNAGRAALIGGYQKAGVTVLGAADRMGLFDRKTSLTRKDVTGFNEGTYK